MLKKIAIGAGLLFAMTVGFVIYAIATVDLDEVEKVEKVEKNSASLAMEEKEEAASKEETYAKARKDTGGHLSQVELDDAAKSSDLHAKITKATVTGDHVAIWASVETNLTAKMTYKSARIGAVDIYEMLSDLDGYKTATIIMSAPGTDAYGNDIEMEALKVTWTKETIDKVNYDQFDFDNLGAVADFYSTTE